MKLLITFPEDYPQTPPLVKLDKPKRYFHPNIGPLTGSICEKTMKDKGPSVKIRDRIDSFSHLLTNPNPDSPLNGDAATLFNKDYRSYFKKALGIFRGTETI